MHVRRYFSFSRHTLLSVWLGILFFALLLKNPALASEGVRRGLMLAARTVIPSLFPSMILSEWLIHSGIGNIPFPFLRPLERLLRLSPAGVLCVLLGVLCGSPVGARCASSAYGRGDITKAEYERILPLASIPSPTFLIGTVGVSLLASYRMGLILYIAALLSSFIIAVLQARIGKARSFSPTISAQPPTLETGSLTALLVRSVRSATEGILSVTAYILLFGTLCDVLFSGIGRLLPDIARSVLMAALELCGGMQALAGTGGTPQALFLIGAAAGWCGLSIHVQIMASSASDAISYRAYGIGKLLQAVLSALLFTLGCRLFGK